MPTASKSKSKPAEAKKEKAPEPEARPLGQEPIIGHFVNVVGGDEAGAYGVYEADLTDEDIQIRTRDDDSRLLTAKKSDCVRAKAGGR